MGCSRCFVVGVWWAGIKRIPTVTGSTNALISAVITYGLADRTNGNGVYNALVLLRHMQRDTIRRNKTTILEFANAVEGVGPKTKERANILRSKLAE